MDDKHEPRAHRKRQAGPKAERKKNKTPHEQEMTAKQRNPKAFAIRSAKKAQNAVRRTIDKKEKKHHIPMVDRNPLEPPPVLVAIVGPAGVGKSTLLRCLVKHFHKQKIGVLKGPITVVTGKKRRVTFVECPSDMNSMIDIAKVADLVLVLIDAKAGLEMEHLEFLHICNVHGMPKVMGVLTHLDHFQQNQKLKTRKKTLTQRFSKELYPGAKLFYLTGLTNGEYLYREVHNLTRFISVMKFRPLTYRNTHPYIIVDRYEDVTPREGREGKEYIRDVTLYGYVRGTHLLNNANVHIPGVGDHQLAEISFLPDPCPLPETETKRRTLEDRGRLIYAPFSEVAGVIYDKDATYVTSSQVTDTKYSKKPGNDLLKKMAENADAETGEESPLDKGLELFSGSAPIYGDKQENVDSDDSDDEEGRKKSKKFEHDSDDYNSDDDEDDEMDCDDDDDDDADSDDDDDEPQSKRRKMDAASEPKGVRKRAYDAYLERQRNKISLEQQIYGGEDSDEEEEDDGEEVGGMFSVKYAAAKKEENEDYPAINMIRPNCACKDRDPRGVDIDALIKSLDYRIMKSRPGGGERLNEDDDDMFGDFEDMESGEKFDDGDEDSNASDNDEEEEEVGNKKTWTNEERKKRALEKRMEKKKRMHEMFKTKLEQAEGEDKGTFYDEWKNEIAQQSQMGREVYEKYDDPKRVQLEGFRPGMYVRVRINDMYKEFIERFNPKFPYIVGGVETTENKAGFIQCNIKSHKFYRRILKCRDPVLVSLGWRRFQTQAIYHKQEDNGRMSYLKYTQLHSHVLATIYGPQTVKGAGMMIYDPKGKFEETPEFRVRATGVVTESNQAIKIQKKLKLIGYPKVIKHKTAFISDMFKSDAEVGMYERAAIQTQSGIRGEVKKAVSRIDKHGVEPGTFRAGFEDKIQMSDTVFLKTFVTLDLSKFKHYVTIMNHLLVKQEGLMKTAAQIRKEKNIKREVNEDSLYKPIERKPFVSKPLKIPAEIEKSLPFKLKTKVTKPVQEVKRVAVIRDDKEKMIAKIMQMAKTIQEYHRKKQRIIMRERAAKHQEKMAKIEANKEVQRKERAKAAFRKLGQKQKQTQRR